MYGEADKYIHTFLTLSVHGDKRSISPSGHLPPGNEPPLDRRFGGPTASMDVVPKRKIFAPSAKGVLAFQPLVSHCTDYAILTP
jgi:hypothetical protein